jgi:uncharacterized protein YidB (DUF937 family)
MMTKTTASTALLGLLALSGYNDQDQISDLLNRIDAQFDRSAAPDQTLPDIDKTFYGDLKTWFTDVDLAATLAGAMTELDEVFAARGYGARINAWFAGDPKPVIAREELADVLGADLLIVLSQKTGLSRDEVLFRLTDALPAALVGLSGPAQTVAANG